MTPGMPLSQITLSSSELVSAAIILWYFAIFAILLTVWAGQDLTYSPAWLHPMAYYDALAFVVAVVLGVSGTALRRGAPEF